MCYLRLLSWSQIHKAKSRRRNINVMTCKTGSVCHIKFNMLSALGLQRKCKSNVSKYTGGEGGVIYALC